MSLHSKLHGVIKDDRNVTFKSIVGIVSLPSSSSFMIVITAAIS